MNGSKMISFGFDAIISKCSISASVFWVGCFGEVIFQEVSKMDIQKNCVFYLEKRNSKCDLYFKGK
jgi:hypothetical protein